MRDQKLEALFEQFRSRGDTAALGLVFDRTASEPLKVARHLTRSASLAEDLLQSTFLTAIERCQSFEAGRPLRPWLLGILVKHANNQRRQISRSLEADRLGARREREPHEIVAESELSLVTEPSA